MDSNKTEKKVNWPKNVRKNVVFEDMTKNELITFCYWIMDDLVARRFKPNVKRERRTEMDS